MLQLLRLQGLQDSVVGHEVAGGLGSRRHSQVLGRGRSLPATSLVELHDRTEVFLFPPRGLVAFFESGRCVLFVLFFTQAGLFFPLLGLVGLLDHVQGRLLVQCRQGLVVVVRVRGARAVIEVDPTSACSLDRDYRAV